MILTLLFTVVLAIILVLVAFLQKINSKKFNNKNYYQLTMMLGSGGHTGEICQLINKFSFSRVHSCNIIISASDKSSENYFKSYLMKWHSEKYEEIMSKTKFHKIMRTNQVKQSFFTSIFSTIQSSIHCLILIYKQLINTTHFVSNGPGTCLPLFFWFFVLKKIRLSRIKLIFIESWCRVKKLSLTGRIIKIISDNFIVHWQDLNQKGEYFGKII